MIPVTDTIKIEVMRSLSASDRTLADLSRMLDIPLSTLFSNLNKMVDEGLIESYSHSDDKRKVLYSQRAAKLIESKAPEPDVAEAASKVIRMALGNSKNFYRGIVTYANMATSILGLDIGPLFERAGRLLANYMADDLKCDRVEELIPKIREYASLAMMPEVSVFTFVPLTIVLQLEYQGAESSNNLFRSAMGFITQAMTNHTGVTYHVTSKEIFGDGHSKMKFVLEPNQTEKDRTSEVLGSKQITVVNAVPAQYFEVYATKRGVLYNSNDTQIKIMHVLVDSKEATLSELSRKLSISQSTIFANLNKMVDDGLIVSCENESDNRKVIYRAAAAKFMSQKDGDIGSHDRALNVMKGAITNPKDFFKCMFEFLVYESDMLGLDISDTATVVGMAFASIVEEENNGSGVESLMSMLTKNSDYIGAKSFKVVTYIPLTIEMQCYLEPVECIASMVKKFYEGFLSIFLTNMSGVAYKARSESKIVDGEMVYHYVLESTSMDSLPNTVTKFIKIK